MGTMELTHQDSSHAQASLSTSHALGSSDMELTLNDCDSPSFIVVPEFSYKDARSEVSTSRANVSPGRNGTLAMSLTMIAEESVEKVSNKLAAAEVDVESVGTEGRSQGSINMDLTRPVSRHSVVGEGRSQGSLNMDLTRPVSWHSMVGEEKGQGSAEGGAISMDLTRPVSRHSMVGVEDKGRGSRNVSMDLTRPVSRHSMVGVEDKGRGSRNVSMDLTRPVSRHSMVGVEDKGRGSRNVSMDLTRPVSRHSMVGVEDKGRGSNNVSIDFTRPVFQHSIIGAEDKGQRSMDMSMEMDIEVGTEDKGQGSTDMDVTRPVTSRTQHSMVLSAGDISEVEEMEVTGVEPSCEEVEIVGGVDMSLDTSVLPEVRTTSTSSNGVSVSIVTRSSPTRSTRSSPTRSTRSSPTRSTRSSPTRSTRSSPTRSTRSSPTRSTRSSPTRSTRSSPTRSTRSSPTRSTRSSPTRSTRSSPTRSTRASPTRSTRASPTRSTRSSPTPSTRSSPTRSTRSSPTPSTRASPTPSTRSSPTPSTRSSPTRSTRASPTRSTRSSPTRSNASAVTRASPTRASPRRSIRTSPTHSSAYAVTRGSPKTSASPRQTGASPIRSLTLAVTRASPRQAMASPACSNGIVASVTTAARDSISALAAIQNESSVQSTIPSVSLSSASSVQTPSESGGSLTSVSNAATSSSVHLPNSSSESGVSSLTSVSNSASASLLRVPSSASEASDDFTPELESAPIAGATGTRSLKSAPVSAIANTPSNQVSAIANTPSNTGLQSAPMSVCDVTAGAGDTSVVAPVSNTAAGQTPMAVSLCEEETTVHVPSSVAISAPLSAAPVSTPTITSSKPPFAPKSGRKPSTTKKPSVQILTPLVHSAVAKSTPGGPVSTPLSSKRGRGLARKVPAKSPALGSNSFGVAISTPLSKRGGKGTSRKTPVKIVAPVSSRVTRSALRDHDMVMSESFVGTRPNVSARGSRGRSKAANQSNRNLEVNNSVAGNGANHNTTIFGGNTSVANESVASTAAPIGSRMRNRTADISSAQHISTTLRDDGNWLQAEDSSFILQSHNTTISPRPAGVGVAKKLSPPGKTVLSGAVGKKQRGGRGRKKNDLRQSLIQSLKDKDSDNEIEIGTPETVVLDSQSKTTHPTNQLAADQSLFAQRDAGTLSEAYRNRQSLMFSPSGFNKFLANQKCDQTLCDDTMRQVDVSEVSSAAEVSIVEQSVISAQAACVEVEVVRNEAVSETVLVQEDVVMSDVETYEDTVDQLSAGALTRSVPVVSGSDAGAKTSGDSDCVVSDLAQCVEVETAEGAEGMEEEGGAKDILSSTFTIDRSTDGNQLPVVSPSKDSVSLPSGHTDVLQAREREHCSSTPPLVSRTPPGMAHVSYAHMSGTSPPPHTSASPPRILNSTSHTLTSPSHTLTFSTRTLTSPSRSLTSPSRTHVNSYDSSAVPQASTSATSHPPQATPITSAMSHPPQGLPRPPHSTSVSPHPPHSPPTSSQSSDDLTPPLSPVPTPLSGLPQGQGSALTAIKAVTTAHARMTNSSAFITQVYSIRTR